MQHIIIADPHTVCRTALESFILHSEEGIHVETVGDYASLQKSLSDKVADLILLDHNLPGLPASPEDMNFDMECPGARIGIMTDAFSEDRFKSGLEGVDIFPKYLASKQFVEGIKKLLSGQRFYIENNFVGTGLNEFEGKGRRSVEDVKLTHREKQVLSYLITGAVNKDIARALDLQVVTIKLHVRGICRKLGVKNRTQAALTAREYGWV